MALTSKDKKGLAIWVGFGVLAVALFMAKLKADGKPKPDEFGCVVPVSSSTVIVVDHTEKVSQQTSQEIVARALAFVQNQVKPNGRVTVFSVSQVSRQNLVPSFSRCKPELDENRLIGSPKLSEKNYKARFLEPLTAALKVEPGDSKESPIAQALIDVSLTQYLRSNKNSLLVFSDMLEHVPAKFSMYSYPTCRDRQSVVKAFRESKKGARERPTFVNTDVQLNIIPRTDVPKTALACRDHLWPWFFGDNEGKDARLTPDYLPGA